MKLQKLSSERFKPFKENVVSNLTTIRGGWYLAMSTSHGFQGNRYDCAESSGKLYSSSGDWGSETWYSGSHPLLTPCARLKDNTQDQSATFIDPKTGNVVSDLNQVTNSNRRF